MLFDAANRGQGNSALLDRTIPALNTRTTRGDLGWQVSSMAQISGLFSQMFSAVEYLTLETTYLVSHPTRKSTMGSTAPSGANFLGRLAM